MNTITEKNIDQIKIRGPSIKSLVQQCPQCDFPIGIMRGTPDAICKNCGFKDPCCGD